MDGLRVFQYQKFRDFTDMSIGTLLLYVMN